MAIMEQLAQMVRDLADVIEEAHDTHIYDQNDDHPDDCGYCRIVAKARALVETSVSKFPFGVALSDEREIAPGVFFARDVDGTGRIHNRRIFMGYVVPWASDRDGSRRFLIHTFGPRLKNREWARYRTAGGAERALVRLALADLGEN